MPVTNANGINQHYELTGNGNQTVVWIHGIGGSLNYWTEDLPKFSNFQHLTYDVRGMGETEGTSDSVSLEIWAKDLSELLKALDINNAIIAGSSMGGAIAQRFAIDNPDQTAALLLLSTSSRVGAAATDHWRAQADETEKKGDKFYRISAKQLDSGMFEVKVKKDEDEKKDEMKETDVMKLVGKDYEVLDGDVCYFHVAT